MSGTTVKQEEPSPALKRTIQNIRLMINRDDLEGALLLVNEALSDEPDSSLLKAEKGRILELSGKSAEAEDLYWSAFEPSRLACPEPFLYLSSLKMQGGDAGKALWILEKGLEQFPSNTELLTEAGVLSALSGQWWVALDRLNRVIRSENPPVEATIAWGSLVTRLGLSEFYPDLVSRYCQIADRNPGDLDSRILYVRALEISDMKRKSLKEVRSLEKIFPKSPLLLRETARILLNNNEFSQAIDAYRRVLDLEGDSASLRQTMALAHKMNGKPLAALEAIKRAIELDPDNEELSLMMAQIILDMGELDRASVLIHQHHHGPSFRNLGDLYLQRKRWNQAVEAYIKSFEIQPLPDVGEDILRLIEKRGGDSFTFLEVLSWMELFFPRRVPARYRAPKFLDGLVGKAGGSGDSPEMMAVEAISAYFRGKPDQAIPLLEKVVMIDPLSEVLFWLLSLCYELAGELTQAIEASSRVLHHTREPVTLFHNIGRLNMKKGEPMSSVTDLLEQFIRYHGPQEGFFRVLAELYLVRNDRDNAILALKDGMQRSQENSSLFEDYKRLVDDPHD